MSIKRNLLSLVATGSVTALSLTGCQSLKNEFKDFSPALRNPIQEVFRYDDEENMKPVELQRGVDYSVHDATTSYRVVNDRAYLRDEPSPKPYLEEIVDVPQLKKYRIPMINATYIEDGSDIILTYPCRTPPPTLAPLISKHLDGIEIEEFPGRNELIFRGPRNTFGDFSRFSNMLNQYDVAPDQIRVRTRIVEYFADNTYDRESVINVLKNVLTDKGYVTSTILNFNLPSNPNPRESLTTGVEINPFFLMNQEGRKDPYTGKIIPPISTFDGVIKFLDSYGKVSILSDSDMLVNNGSTVTFKNQNSVPFPEILINAMNVVETVKYRETGMDLEITPFANEEGFITVNLTKAESGEQTGYVGTVQRPTFRTSNLSTECILREGTTYFVGTSLNTRYKSVERGVPFMNKVPLIKAAFTSESIEKNSSVLLYFMEARKVNRNSLLGTQSIR
jgi:type II secretory pathway component GspD/PulD (secretin)